LKKPSKGKVEKRELLKGSSLRETTGRSQNVALDEAPRKGIILLREGEGDARGGKLSSASPDSV